MKVVFSPIARQELEDAALYLEAEFEGLGEAFKDEAKLAAQRLGRYRWPGQSNGAILDDVFFIGFHTNFPIRSKQIMY